MKLTIALIVLVITQVIAENDNKDAEEVETKSAQKDDVAQTEDEVTRAAETFTVPVEVVTDAVTESESVRKANENKEERVQRSTTTDMDFKSDDDSKLLSESEHVENRRSSDDTTKAADDEKLHKSSDSDDASEKTAKTDAEAEKDLSKKGEADEKQDESEDRRAKDGAHENSEVEVKSAVDETEGLEKMAADDAFSSLVTESAGDLEANLNTRRMLNPIETVLEMKARSGDNQHVHDHNVNDESAISKSAEALRSSFDSSRPYESQTIPPPLMSLPIKQNFFLRPPLPVRPPFFVTPTQETFKPLPSVFSNIPPMQNNFLRLPEQKPFDNFNAYPFQPFPQTTVRPLPLQMAKLPNYQDLFKKNPEDSRSRENFQQFPINGFNRPMNVPFSIPNYLRYSP